MRYTIRVRHCLRVWRNSWYFVLTALISFQAYSKPLVFSLSGEEREQLKYQKIMEIQSRQVMTLDLDPSSTNLLTEQTFVDWQNTWVEQYLDANYFGTDSYLYWIAYSFWDQGDTGNNMFVARKDLDHIAYNLLPAMYKTNNVFALTTKDQLNQVISKLDKLTGDDGNGNPNINVNFQPIEQSLDDINKNVDSSRMYLENIDQIHLPDIVHYLQLNRNNITNIIHSIEDGFETNNRNLQTANNTLAHIDSDLHDMKTDLGELLIQFGDGGSINGDTIKNLSESIANQLNLTLSPVLQAETKKVVDSIDQKFELASSDMSEVGVAETAGNYLNSEMRLATDQLRSELQGLQYTNINAVVYDYDDYSNYYTLSGYADNPPSNDVFIRQKVQDYIDAVNYATENVKGQITTRLDELKQSTLLTTSYDPEWLVVKAGGLYSKGGNQFPDEDWSVDFSKIKLDSDISKVIYDWIYYVMACVIIYRQFRKVVD